MHFQGSKFSEKIDNFGEKFDKFGGKSFLELRSAEFMGFVFSKSVVGGIKLYYNDVASLGRTSLYHCDVARVYGATQYCTAVATEGGNTL